jgi:AbiV family abortive infection protein
VRPVPSNDQLQSLIPALLSNASSLLDDAALLLRHGRAPRAFALAALAGEELGKVYLCLSALLPGDEIEGKQFWWAWRHHGDKVDSMRSYAAAFVDDLESLAVDRLGAEAEAIAAKKLSAFYVDFDGTTVEVPEQVSLEEAQTLLEATRRSVEHAGRYLGGMTPDVLEAIHDLAPLLAPFFDQLTNDRAPKDVLADFRQLLRELPEMSVDELIALLAPAQSPPVD